MVAASSVYVSPVGWVFWLVWLGLGIYIAMDAGKLPDWAFERAGTKKSTWQVWPIVSGVLCCIPVLVFAIMWFTSKKEQVEAAARGGGPGVPPGYGYPGTAGPGWAPPPQGGQAPPPGYQPWPGQEPGGSPPPPAPPGPPGPPQPPQGPPPGS